MACGSLAFMSKLLVDPSMSALPIDSGRLILIFSATVILRMLTEKGNVRLILIFTANTDCGSDMAFRVEYWLRWNVRYVRLCPRQYRRRIVRPFRWDRCVCVCVSMYPCVSEITEPPAIPQQPREDNQEQQTRTTTTTTTTTITTETRVKKHKSLIDFSSNNVYTIVSHCTMYSS